MRYSGFLLIASFLTGCGGSGDGTGADCARTDDWREPVYMVDGVASVQITNTCSNDLVITEATLDGVGFEADLPEVGDVVVGEDWIVEVYFTSESPHDGEYQTTLTIQADGLVDMPSRDIIYVVGEVDDTASDTGL